MSYRRRDLPFLRMQQSTINLEISFAYVQIGNPSRKKFWSCAGFYRLLILLILRILRILTHKFYRHVP
jgi:hypothetical protein